MSLEGQRLGEFEILGKLGQGGMGAVYRARQISLDRLVALKILPSQFEADAEFVNRFQREARLAASLNHPNLVSVFSSGLADGCHYIAMELIKGETLGDWLKRGALPPLEALRITLDVVRALDCGWQRAQLIHRDIKPANIFLSTSGEVKLGDLGLAKSLDGESTAMTQTGTSMGTPHYMSPEQARGDKALDFRADIYSLGCTLYQMLTGRTPYEGRDPVVVLNQHINAPPPAILKVMPGCPIPLARLVGKMLRKQWRERHASYGELVASIENVQAILEHKAGAAETTLAPDPETAPLPAASSPTAKQTPKSKLPLYATIAAGVMLVGVALFFAFGKSGEVLSEAQRAEKARVERAAPSRVSSGADDGSARGATRSTLPAATKDKPFVNTLGQEFVPVPGTQVLFCRWETRVKDWAAYALANKVAGKGGNQPEHPVAIVNWEDANGFCAWLTEKESAEGKLPKGMKYRLPTDEEWSRAVGLAKEDGATPKERNGKNSVDFPWGRDWPPKEKVGTYADESFHKFYPRMKWLEGYTDGFAATAPVGSFPPNELGIYDLGGNVWEWCEDWYDAAQKDRVLRGASWDNDDRNKLLSSNRSRFGDTNPFFNFGFRCVVGVSAPPTAVQPPPQTGSGTLPAATKDKPFVNTLGQEFVPVPGTQVLFCRWETRMKDYAAYALANKAAAKAGNQPEHPVAMVSWEEANRFCAWLTGKEIAEGKLRAGMAYRLPTDEEWSRAVGLAKEDGATPKERSGKNSVDFPWGRDWPPKGKVGNYADESFHGVYGVRWNFKWLEGYTDGFATTAPVGSFPPNELGIYDLGGNVWEWCEDWYDAAQKDRVLRGASWDNDDRNTLLSSNRGRFGDTNRFRNFGFRCVVGVSAPPTAVIPPQTGSGTLPAATKDKPFVNTLGQEFVPVPGTQVLFCRWETRVKDYAAFVQEANHEWKKAAYEQGPTHPAVNVSGDDAQAYCVWLTERERKAGKLGTNERYRLPTDHEWSCAVGIGEQEDGAKLPAGSGQTVVEGFPWGTAWPPPIGAGNFAGEELKPAIAEGKYPSLAGVITGYRDGYLETAPVGSFPANGVGLHDLIGNVWEWSEDADDGQQKGRVLRGGSWYSNDRRNLSSSYRNRPSATSRADLRGFRCVVGVSAPPTAVQPPPQTGSGTLPAATKDKPFVNTLGMEFVPVPGTQVLFCRWETRVKDYAEFAKVNKVDESWTKAEFKPEFDSVPVGREPGHPVCSVNWDEAKAFCKWLTEKESAEGKLPNGMKYRLPTDEEWSKAVGLAKEDGATPKDRSGKNKVHFPWGGEYPPKGKVGNYGDESFHGKFPQLKDRWIEGYMDGFATTAPVGSFAPNDYGIYDLGGNGWEWCEDWYDTEQKHRVVRGASWIKAERDGLLSSHRFYLAPGFHYIFTGFRCVVGVSTP